jgi:hypothetical protein
MTSPDVNAPQRTYQTFMLQTHEGLQNGDSPFINAGIGMVSQLPIDYMHLVCLGVAKRILLMWIKGSLDISIGPRAVEEISATLKSLKACISCELVRKPRSLAHVEVDSWTATEFRQFLLYIGPVVLLKHTIHPHMYKSTCCCQLGFISC